MQSGLGKRWIISCLGVTVAILLAAVFIFTATVRTSYYNSVTNLLITRADSSARLFRNYINTSAKEFYAGAARYAESFAEKEKLEFEVVGTDGRVIYSSSFSRLTGYEPGTPDVWEAISEEKTSSFSGEDSVTGQNVISASAPVYLSGGELVGAVRYVTGVELINSRVTTLCVCACAVAAGGLLLVIVTGVYFLTSIISPLKRINSAAKTIASGRYGETIDYDRDDEIGELVSSVNFMSREIERSANIKNEFISSVSHELITPLTAINGWAETLIADEDDPESLRAKGLETIRQESRRLGRLVEELLDFSRMESGRMLLNKSRFDLNAELEDTIFMMEQRINRDGIHIVYTDATEESYVNGDPQRIRQVLVNIIDNARKFSPSGSKIDISIEDDPKTDIVYITVKDRGCGIPKEALPHVKEKFFKGNSEKAGSGIGLALCSEIMALHNGTLEIESEVGVGTEVKIGLPLV
ncbi:MAG: HAMP domain-containing protein [Clostridia bacterium]|nr:HAMP domain-containing protein [Clostridia bacterium]